MGTILNALYRGTTLQDTCELPQIGLHVVDDLSGTMVSHPGKAGLLSMTLPGTPQTIFPSGEKGLQATLPHAATGVQNLGATGGSDLMMPHAIGVGMGMDTTSGFLQVHWFWFDDMQRL